MFKLNYADPPPPPTPPPPLPPPPPKHTHISTAWLKLHEAAQPLKVKTDKSLNGRKLHFTAMLKVFRTADPGPNFIPFSPGSGFNAIIDLVRGILFIFGPGPDLVPHFAAATKWPNGTKWLGHEVGLRTKRTSTFHFNAINNVEDATFTKESSTNMHTY